MAFVSNIALLHQNEVAWLEFLIFGKVYTKYKNPRIVPSFQMYYSWLKNKPLQEWKIQTMYISRLKSLVSIYTVLRFLFTCFIMKVSLENLNPHLQI